MARMILPGLLLAALAASGQQPADFQFQQAGECARCHVISVVEWGISGHQRVGTDCVACHGVSEGHVIDERNNIKPEHVAQGAAIAGMCANCHAAGCPKTKQKAECQNCHHFHALVDPNKPPVVRDEGLEKRTVLLARYDARMREGESHYRAGAWERAREAFRAALQARPGDARAALRLTASERRLRGSLPGFELVTQAFDEAAGLPREVRVAGIGTPMVLVPGGEFEMGSEKFPATAPVHTVRVEPFYLARFEVTRGDWCAVMGGDANACNETSARMPLTGVSWQDAQTFVQKLNERVPGGGFRLPTEAEWELAARGSGSSAPDLAEIAFYGDFGRDAGPKPVGSRKPNRLGIFDLQGNVWEWCSSLHKPYPYDPLDGREAVDASGLRVLRGGSYSDTAGLLDAAFRHGLPADRRLRWNGFRLARSIPEIPRTAVATDTRR
jgi:formylglycine-generating enzyme required for sulfatase activity